MGKLFIIEGIDGSGKTTQISLLKSKLIKSGYDVMQIKFPDYKSDSSALVKMYLKGDFGNNPSDVNPYAASAFYTVDRYASFKLHWEKEYLSDKIIISDRYVTSNIIHQASKLDLDKQNDFCKWLYDFEYNKIGLPRPDKTFFLDVPPSVTLKQVEKRYKGNEDLKDIHEKDVEYLTNCYNTGVNSCKNGFMTSINCIHNSNLRSIYDINNEIFTDIVNIIRGNIK